MNKNDKKVELAIVELYKNAVRNYLTHKRTDETGAIKYYLVSEYQNILKKVFGYADTELSDMYQKLYWEVNGKEVAS